MLLMKLRICSGKDVSEFEITENAESEDDSSSESEDAESDEGEGEKNE